MTHDELLAKINEYLQDCEDHIRMEGKEGYEALRAVVAIHKPVYWQGIEMVCDWCDITSYPCPTIEAIEKELG